MAASSTSGLHLVGWGRSSSMPFVALGAACVVGGGLASAVTAPMASYHSSWAVAYVVLVGGVAQALLGLGQAVLTADAVPRRVVGYQLAGWNLGNVAVVVGTLLDLAPLLYVGCVLLVGALALVLYAIRGARGGRALLVTRAVVVLLLVSIPTGIVIQALTH